MSSLGDVVHALPAVTEAARLVGARFDWLVEEAFADVPRLHPAVAQVIPLALRRWRHEPLAALRSAEWRALRARLRQAEYDLILDAQGLLKSAVMVAMTRGPSAGFDQRSARERPAAWFYDRRYPVPGGGHAVERLRLLFAQAMGYVPHHSRPGYGLRLPPTAVVQEAPYLVLLHGSSWPTKRWPVEFWQSLAALAVGAGYRVRLPWGSEAERETALRIAEVAPGAQVLPPMRLGELAQVLGEAAGAIGVDGGPSHLAVATGVPTTIAYSASDPARTGPWGAAASVAAVEFSCAPCLRKRCRFAAGRKGSPPCGDTLPAAAVWQQFSRQLAARADQSGTGAR